MYLVYNFFCKYGGMHFGTDFKHHNILNYEDMIDPVAQLVQKLVEHDFGTDNVVCVVCSVCSVVIVCIVCSV